MGNAGRGASPQSDWLIPAVGLREESCTESAGGVWKCVLPTALRLSGCSGTVRAANEGERPLNPSVHLSESAACGRDHRSTEVPRRQSRGGRLIVAGWTRCCKAND